MRYMPTRHLRLRKCSDGYYRTSWVDEQGGRHNRSFGKHRGAAYNRFSLFHHEWKRDPALRNPTGDAFVTIQRAWQLFGVHADAHYRRPGGVPTGEAANFADAMRPVLELFAGRLASQFGPKALKAVRERMIEDDLCLNTINARVRRIRHVWKWLASEELIPASVWHGLQAVSALQEGRTEARATDDVGPVPDEYIWQVAEHAPPTVRAMIEVQFWSGMRPGEVCTMRPADLKMDGEVWLYRPAEHKTRYRKRDRVVLLGPRAQKAIAPFLQRDTHAYLFSPLEARRQRFAERPSCRHQAVETPRTERQVGDHYGAKAYGHCIAVVCKRHGIPHWSPNQLRHNVATRIRQRFGLDAAQVILGHKSADVTQLYAEADQRRAAAVIEQVG